MTAMDNNDKEYTESKENRESFDTPEQSRTKMRAIKMLGNRHLSSKEMGKRLVRKGESEEAAQETVKWLEDIGAVNDVEYAEAIVRHYTTKGYGAARVRDELYKRGIPRELWDDAVACTEAEESEEATHRFLERKLGDGSDKEDLKKTMSALCRRGFSYEEARAAVNKYLETLENTEKISDADM